MPEPNFPLTVREKRVDDKLDQLFGFIRSIISNNRQQEAYYRKENNSGMADWCQGQHESAQRILNKFRELDFDE